MKAKDVRAGDTVTLFGAEHVVEQPGETDGEGTMRIGFRMARSPGGVAVLTSLTLDPEFDLIELCEVECARDRDATDIQDASFMVQHPALFTRADRQVAEDTLRHSTQFAAQD